MSRLPTASRLMFHDADRYRSISDGDTVRTSAMLSNPLLSSSGGRSAAASMSSARRSRIALAYSARFRRCMDVRPGRGFVRPPRDRALFRGKRPGRRVGLVPAAACRAAASSRRAACGSLFPRSRRLWERPSGRRVRATARPRGLVVVARDAVLAHDRRVRGRTGLDWLLRRASCHRWPDRTRGDQNCQVTCERPCSQQETSGPAKAGH